MTLPTMQTMGSYLPIPFAQSDAIETASQLSGSWSLSMLVPILLGAAGYLLMQHGIVKGQAVSAARSDYRHSFGC
jgi:hypothetical protein